MKGFEISDLCPTLNSSPNREGAGGWGFII